MLCFLIKIISHYYSHHLDNVWMDGVWRCYIFKKKLAQVRGFNKQKIQAKCEVLFSYRLSKNGFFVKPPSTLPSFGSVVSILGCLVGAAQLTFQVPFLFCILLKNGKCVCKPSGYVKSPQNFFRKKIVWCKILQLFWHICFPPIGGNRWLIFIHIDIYLIHWFFRFYQLSW